MRGIIDGRNEFQSLPLLLLLLLLLLSLALTALALSLFLRIHLLKTITHSITHSSPGLPPVRRDDARAHRGPARGVPQARRRRRLDRWREAAHLRRDGHGPVPVPAARGKREDEEEEDEKKGICGIGERKREREMKGMEGAGKH